jgi:UDP-N-acetylmuramate--alanine ligase
VPHDGLQMNCSMNHKDKVRQAVQLLENGSATIHLVGAGGSGMAGIARLLLDDGYPVTGSDQRRNEVVDSLLARGMTVFHGHAADHLGQADAVVYSTAVTESNPERAAARKKGIPEFRRAEFLSALLARNEVIVVCGTHGKTTTTMMLARILIDAGLDPTYYIGAEVPTFGTSAARGKGKLAVVEADESDGTFLAFDPAHAIILNIDRDHLDFYSSDEEILQAFEEIASRTPGHRVLCADDEGCRQLGAGLDPKEWYGLGENADIRLRSSAPSAGGTDFSIEADGPDAGSLHAHLSLPGRHNLSNALAALTLARALGVDLTRACQSLATLVGASRRFEIVYEGEFGKIVDDYAHHPVEIKATLATARSAHPGPLSVVFQPHRYSRTRALMDDFSRAFEEAEKVVVAGVYGAGEPKPDDDPAEALVQALSAQGVDCRYEPRESRLPALAMEALSPEAMLLTLGAGNIDNLAHSLADAFRLGEILKSKLGAESRVRLFEPMRKHTTLRVGGPAFVWVEPATETDVATVLREAREAGWPWMVIGNGSNLLVREGGIRAVCLHLTQTEFKAIQAEENRIFAGAGARLKEISYTAMRSGIRGFEFMEGIPASLGGALRMNAGAMQSWMFEVVESVRIATSDGEIRDLPRSEFAARYRHVPQLDQAVALGATLKGEEDDPDEIKERMKLYSTKRWSSQPAAPSAGCTFKNPEGDAAGRLIDELGLKDKKIGGARISSVHANFIVNDGGATADDVLELIEFVQRTARDKKGIELETEVVTVGEA